MATAAEVEFWKDMCRKESARNNKLRSEWDEAIRQQLAADDARKTAESVANGLEWEVEELASENAKLRELIAKYSSAAKYLCGFSHCNECNLDCASVFGDVPSGWDCARMLLNKRARELGVEVDW